MGMTIEEEEQEDQSTTVDVEQSLPSQSEMEFST
jgi:hypothetical protein